MHIASVSPGAGSRTGGSTVVIGGQGFPDRPVVLLGGAVAQVSVAWPTMLLVHTPAHTPGVVDVTVSDGTTTAVAPGAYTYVSDTPAPTSPPPSSPAPTTTTTVAPTTSTTAAPSTTSTSTSTTEAPASTSTSTSTSTTSTTLAPQPIEARGLHLVPLAGSHPLAGTSPGGWPQRRCTSGSCAGSPVRS